MNQWIEKLSTAVIKMAYDFECPLCSWGQNFEDCVHEDYLNVPGEYEIECQNCNKELVVHAEVIMTYDAVKKIQKQE